MSSYAILDTNNLVVNVVEWDGISVWTPPENTTLIMVTDVTGTAFIGLAYNGTTFDAPAVVTPPSQSLP